MRKCIVWDLDNTLWDGIAIESNVKVKPEIRQIIQTLDNRGILHSIASRSEQTRAMQILQDHNLAGYFLVPRINWLPKSTNIITISKTIHLSLDAIAFVDDDPFELEQISFMLPDVLTIPAARAPDLLYMPDFSPGTVTAESRERRSFYQAEQQRRNSECGYATRLDFLKSCAMKLKIRALQANDIPRVLELMSRTHQLNTTGRQFTADELYKLLYSGEGSANVKVAELTDKFGGYGIIGTAVAEKSNSAWKLIYLALSCRISGRGIEQAFLSFLLEEPRAQGLHYAEALFCDTGKNRMMRALYQMLNFTRYTNTGQEYIFQLDLSLPPVKPEWVEVI